MSVSESCNPRLIKYKNFIEYRVICYFKHFANPEIKYS